MPANPSSSFEPRTTCRHPVAAPRKCLAGNVSEQSALSDLVVRALWLSFPNEGSEDAIAVAATPYFRNKMGEPISQRTIRYWLRGETLPSALHLVALVRMQPRLFLAHWLGVGS